MEYDPELLLSDYAIGYYEISLEGMAKDRLQSAAFMLDADVSSGRKLSLRQSMTYLYDYIRFGIGKWLEFFGSEATVDYNLPPGSFRPKNKTKAYHLPFTCATQVANVMNKLFELEPAYDCHLPEAMYINLQQLALVGYGEFYARDYLGVV
jgi:hypothetical protein